MHYGNELSHLGYCLTYIVDKYGISHLFLLRNKLSFYSGFFLPHISLLSLCATCVKIHIGDDMSKHKYATAL